MSDVDRQVLPPPPTSPRWRWIDRLVLLVVAIVLPLPALGLLAGVRPATIENRPLLTAPPVSFGALAQPEWYAALDHYIADNIAVRPQAVRLRARLDLALSGSPNPDVIRGVDGWLFYRDDLVPVCSVQAPELIARLDAITASLSARGQAFRFLIAPDKHVFYGDKRRPDDGIPTPCTDLNRPALRAAIDARPAVAVDGWASVEAAAREQPDVSLYFRQDSHWTPTAALSAVRDLMRSLDPAIWSDADLVPTDPVAVQMDLAQILGLVETEQAVNPLVRPGVRLSPLPVNVPAGSSLPYPIVRYAATGDRPVLPGRTVIFYDSYFGRHTEQISTFFADITWVHIDDLKRSPDIVRGLGDFDRVIYQEVERYVYRVQLDTLLAPVLRSSR